MVQIKTIESNGKIFLGKEFVGESVLIENPEYGVWTIKIGKFIPDNEKRLLDKDNVKKIDEALNWVAHNPPIETDLSELEKSLLSENNNV